MSKPLLEWEAVGFEYPSREAASEVFGRAMAELHDCSLWATATEELDRWFIIGLFHKGAEKTLETFNWGEGKSFRPSKAQAHWMAERRLVRGLTAVLTGEETVREHNHYEQADAPRIPGE